MEIYNENVRDLLGKDQNAKLEVYYLSCSQIIVTLQFFQKLILVLMAFLLVVIQLCLFFSLMVLGEREARCWSLCEGFVIVCYEQCR